jgi:3,2-trans-enoyl-CoA isomerase
MLALSCDYRIMGEKGGKIGLNESQLGIVAPPWLGQQMIDTVGRRETEKALALGTLYAPSEALAIQLVDEVVDQQQVREAAVRAASQWAKIPPPARVASKLLLRKVVRTSSVY